MCERDWEKLLYWARTRLIALAAGYGVPEGEREDIVQEALLSFYGRRNVRHPEAYLKGVVVRLCKQYWRRSYLRGEEPLESAPPEETTVPPAQEDWTQNEDIARVSAELPEHYREILLLRFVLGYDAAEIARLLDRDKRAVYNLCHRTLQALGETAIKKGIQQLFDESTVRRAGKGSGLSLDSPTPEEDLVERAERLLRRLREASKDK